jgi:hypothetical protein
MKMLVFVSLVLSSTLVIAQSQSIEEVGKSPVEAKFAAGGQIRMDLCPSGAEIIGRDDDHLRVSYDSWKSHDDVKVRVDVMGDHADLRVSGCPHNNFHLTVEVPKSSDLYVRMPAGEMNIRDTVGNKNVEMHAGQLTVDIGQPADYAHVDASVLTGDLEAPPFDVSKGGLFRSFERSGPGKYRVHAHLGAGEIDFR